MDNKEFRFKMCVAKRWLTNKPNTTLWKGIYFKDLPMHEYDVSLSELKQLVETGKTLSYLYKDEEFIRDEGYCVENYMGTQFICIDVDESDEDPETYVSHIKYKPTVYHTTFSNLTEEKNFKWCFHLIYIFDDVIYGEKNFSKIFYELASDIAYDNAAKDPHRCIFTSNSTFPDFRYVETGTIYPASMVDSLPDDIQEENSPKNERLTKKLSDSEISIDKDFKNDFFTMDKMEFINKYMVKYPCKTETYIDPSRYNNYGYADLRKTNYYVVPSSKGKWNNEVKRKVIPTVQKGRRKVTLFMDAVAFMYIMPDMTIEHLIYCLAHQTFLHYEMDNEINRDFIFKQAVNVFKNIYRYNADAQKVKKTFKIDQQFWMEKYCADGKGCCDWLEVTNIIRKIMYSLEVGSAYDLSQSLEKNLSDMKNAGIKTSKRTLMKWLKDNGINYDTDKDKLKNEVKRLRCEHPEYTIRIISQMTGVPKSNVQRYINA